MEALGVSAAVRLLVPPLIWAAYVLFCRDIELACDENVIRDMKSDEKKPTPMPWYP